MKSRALRFALLALFVGALAGAAYAVWNEESQRVSITTAAQAFDERARSISRAFLDIKGAQPGYVSAGQGDDYWATKVDALVTSVREGLSTLPPLARTPSAASEIDIAADAFEDFQQMDRRAREYAHGGQRLLASDLVFSDGIEKMDAALSALDRARTIELASRDSSVRRHRRTQITALAAAAAFGALIVFALVPLPRPQIPAVTEVNTRPEAPAAPGPRRTPTPAGALAAPVAVAPLPKPLPVSLPTPVSNAVDLNSIAALCTDLARVPDQTGLPAALERAAKLLDASGIVLWIVDPDGGELIPIVAHGYSHGLFARLGTIPRDAENATAAAFRTGLLQTVRADPVSHGAIAAPLLTPAGPVGVMAAEVLNDGEQKETTRAATTIVAAQLAALMGPPSSRPQGKTEAAGA